MEEAETDTMFDGHAGIVFRIKQHTFERDLRDRPLLVLATNDDGTFTLHRWMKDGVGPAHDYKDARSAAARMLQLLNIGPVAPQTWPEETCLGHLAGGELTNEE